MQCPDKALDCPPVLLPNTGPAIREAQIDPLLTMVPSFERMEPVRRPVEPSRTVLLTSIRPAENAAYGFDSTSPRIARRTGTPVPAVLIPSPHGETLFATYPEDI
ncbi:hypothetical protein RSOL_079820, partial [Rhizoctonia solani AG-3 Rhs1AP]